MKPIHLFIACLLFVGLGAVCGYQAVVFMSDVVGGNQVVISQMFQDGDIDE